MKNKNRNDMEIEQPSIDEKVIPKVKDKKVSKIKTEYDGKTIAIFVLSLILAVVIALVIAVPITYFVAKQIGIDSAKSIPTEGTGGDSGQTGGDITDGGNTGSGGANGGDSGQTGGEDAGEVKPSTPWMPSNFGVGQGMTWQDKIFAPFVDITAYTVEAQYSNQGALNLKAIKDESGIKFYNLGFITNVTGATSAIREIGTDKKKIIDWGFGGYAIGEYHTDKWQYDGIKKSIKDLRDAGGDVVISIGGLDGEKFFTITQDESIFENTYRDIIYGFGLTRIDLDIEGGAQNKDYHVASAKALKNIQTENSKIQVALTLPVMDTGLLPIAKDVVNTYLEYGVEIKLINIMTMCYGTSAGSYDDASIRAIDNTMQNIKDMWSQKLSENLTDSEAYDKIGFTNSIGFEGDTHPIFTTEMSDKVVKHAREKGVNLASFWCMNRDIMVQANTGIYQEYEHSDVYKSYYKY